MRWPAPHITAGRHWPWRLNYGSQDELVRAAQAAAAQGADSPLEAIEANLDTADMPPLDLLIRTSGEQRLSNFMLWQAAYAEFWFTDTLWPDFNKDELAARAECVCRPRTALMVVDERGLLANFRRRTKV